MHIHDTSTASIAATLPTAALRAEFLLSNLFQVGAANFHYWTTDRTIVGAIVPGASALELPNPPEVRSAFFLERREAGVINLGGPGTITVNGVIQTLASLDGLYLGRGTKMVSFASGSVEQPARFYFLSYPAHAVYPVRHVAFQDATPARLGAVATANDRTIYKYFHLSVSHGLHAPRVGQCVEHDAAAHAFAALGGLLLFPGAGGSGRLPFHGRAGHDASLGGARSRGGPFTAMVDSQRRRDCRL